MDEKKYAKSLDYLHYLLIFIFFISALILATKIDGGIIPDEGTHIRITMVFTKSLGIPEDTDEIIRHGVYIKDHNFLFYWIEARLLNLFQLVSRNDETTALNIFLRITNVIFSTCTLYVTSLISKKLIKNPLINIIPVLLLANTLMYFILSAGVNYDNLANLLAALSVLFLIKSIQKEDWFISSLWLVLTLTMGVLTKYALLPLALISVAVWFYFTLKEKLFNEPHRINKRTVFPIILLIITLPLATELYIGNIFQYKSITPSCNDLFEEEQCAISPFRKRLEDIGLPEKLTYNTAMEKGYPSIFKYLPTWMKLIAVRTFGILGHKNYFQPKISKIILLVILLIYLLGILSLKKPSRTFFSLLIITIFYLAVLFFQNYDIELIYGFKHVALQGRYIFPVIVPIYVSIGILLQSFKFKTLRVVLSCLICGLIVYSGPIVILLKYNEFFVNWIR